MATATLKRILVLGPYSAGLRLAPREFDRAEFAEGWRYELINGVLVVSPIPLEQERDPNEELGHWLRTYRDTNPKATIDRTLSEHTIKTGANRRRCDRVIWAGLGRLPRSGETPTIIAEFVSKGKRDQKRDYEEKRDEYMAIKVQEYWIIDRFQRTMTIFINQGAGFKKRVIQENQIYTTKLLPGFEVPLAKLLALADDWNENNEERET
jgi:Uma2 family endonuclease